MTLGEKLKFARKKAGLSQEQLAEKLAVSRSAIAKWETEKGLPDINNIKYIAKVLNVSIDYLLDDETEMDLSVERKTINLGDYSDRKINFLNKKKVKDKVVFSMFPKAEICSLLAEEKLTKPEKAVDMAIAILSPLLDMVKMSKQLNNLDNQYYMVTLESRKYLVLVTDEYVESRMLPEINTDKKFEIGNCQFINCGPIKTAD